MDAGNAGAEEFAHRSHGVQRFAEPGTAVGHRRNPDRIGDVAGHAHLLVHCEEGFRRAA